MPEAEQAAQQGAAPDTDAIVGVVVEPPAPVPADTVEAPLAWPWVALGVALLLGVVASWLARRRPPPAVAVDPLTVEPLRPAPDPVVAPAGLWDRLSKTRAAFRGSLDALLGRDRIDDEALEALEDALLLADVGVSTAERLVAAVRDRVGRGGADGDALRDVLREEMLTMLRAVDTDVAAPRPVDGGPFVLLVVGVNGSGKTTSIGKLAARFTRDGHRVVLGAADTFRAAAADQLAVWAERAGAVLVRDEEGADPAAVAYAAMERAAADGADVVFVDTAGRLQNARPLMEQLGKIRRVLCKKVPGAPHETWLVIDGTMGQNALAQARAFHDATPLSGVVVTKLDGTAKGGMVLAIAQELKLPVRWIGVGEQVDDLRPFDPDAFVEALL